MWMTTAGARFAASIPANRCLSSKTRIEPHVNNDFAHLTPSAADLLSEPSEKRIRAIKSRRWVLYPRAKQALDHLSPPQGNTHALGCRIRRQRHGQDHDHGTIP